METPARSYDRDVDNFKDDLQALYPGSSGDRKFLVANLELLTDKQVTLPMENVIQFGEYYRAFAKVLTF